jgi:hypothetical protein
MNRGTRKAASRKQGGGGGFSLFSRIWQPFGHILMAGEETGQQLGTSAGRIVRETIGAVRKAGSSIASHSNMAVRNLTARRSGRKGASRRGASRRASRK